MISVMIGRHPKCAIVIDDPTVSRIHAQLVEVAPDQFLLNDENSTCGTFVLEPPDWRRITKATLRGADRVRLGGFETSVQDLLRARRHETGRPGVVERDPLTGEIIVRTR